MLSYFVIMVNLEDSNLLKSKFAIGPDFKPV
jgi:hypothetical protein